MKNRIVAAVLILLASVAFLVIARHSAGLVGYLAGGLGAGVGASIVRARGPSRVWKAAWLCHGAAFVSCAVVMVSLGAGFAPVMLASALIPTLLYGSAALLFATSD